MKKTGFALLLALALLLASSFGAMAQEVTDDEPFLTGVVADATTNAVVVRDAEGNEYAFNKNDKTDYSGLANGLTVGQSVVVTYEGQIDWEKHDASQVTLLSVADAAPAAEIYMDELTLDEPFEKDLDGDGKAETLLLFNAPSKTMEGEDALSLRVTGADGKSVEFVTDVANQGGGALVDLDATDGLIDIVLTGDVMSDDFYTWCLTWKDGAFAQRQYEGAEKDMPLPGAFYAVGEGFLSLNSWVDVLGTWGMTTEYELTEDGGIRHIEGALWMYPDDCEPDWERALVVKKALTVNMITSDGTVEETLPIGTKLLPVYTDCEGEFGFQLEDGREGWLNYEAAAKGWGSSIAGEDEETWFESLPYAG